MTTYESARGGSLIGASRAHAKVAHVWPWHAAGESILRRKFKPAQCSSKRVYHR